MPYIPKDARPQFDKHISELCPKTPGELNYIITRLCDQYVNELLSYQRINDVMGVLTCAQHEIYRRKAAHYEDGKCYQYGDVFKKAPSVAG